MDIESPEINVKKDTSKKISFRNILIPLCIIFLLFTTLSFAYLYYSTASNKENPETPQTTNLLLEEDFLNIDELMLSLSKVLIQEDVDIKRGTAIYNLDVFGISLNDIQNERLTNFLKEETESSITTYTSDDLTFETRYNYDELFFDRDEWNYFTYAELTDVYTNSGHLCIYHIGSEDPSIVCLYANDLSNNNKDYVSIFLEDLINDANLPCQEDECLIQQTKEYPIPLPIYSRSVLHFESLEKTVDNQDIKDGDTIQNNAELINLFFLERNWNSKVEDYTETEKSWDRDVLKSNKVTASNDYFTCDYILSLTSNIRHSIECHYNEDVLLNYQKDIDSMLTTNE